MTLRIASSDELVGLYGQYCALVESNRAGTLEIELAPGTYGVASIGPIMFDLGGNPAPKDPQIDIIIRGAAKEPPVVFRDLGIVVNARSLQLENLVLTGRGQKLLDAHVAETFTMRDCVVAGNTWGGPWEGSLVNVAGVHGKPPYSVRIEDTWFVRNDEQSRSTLLAIRAATGSYVERVELARVAFVDNATSFDVLIEEAREIQIDDLIAVKQRGDTVLRYARAERVRVERGAFVVRDAHAIAEEDTRTWKSGMELHDSIVYAADPSVQPRATVRNVAVRDRGALRPLDALDEIAASIASRVPDATAARARLADALGLRW
jgi:hypothetical protein